MSKPVPKPVPAPEHAPLAYACVALVDRRGWLLMQERDEHPVIDPERWGFPGGGVEPGETSLAAARRELAEETGIRLTGDPELYAELEVAPLGEPVRCAVYAAATELTDDDVECHEGRQMLFVDPRVARSLDLTAPLSATLEGFLGSDLYRRLAGTRRTGHP